MPDTSGAVRIFDLPTETAEHYDTTAHEFAWIVASAATRSADELDAVLTTLLTPLLGDEGADEAHVGLALTIRRLALFVRSLTSGAGGSAHPLADNLRRHEDLSSVQGEQLVARLETWLQSDGGRS